MRRSLLRLVDGRNALDHAGLLGTLPALARAASGTCLGRAGPVEPSEVHLSGPDRGGLGGAERAVAGGVRADVRARWPDFLDVPPRTYVIHRPLFPPLVLSVHFYALLALFVWLAILLRREIGGAESKA